MSQPVLFSALESAALDYALPTELVARYPAPDRDRSRLLVIDRKHGTWEHGQFGDLVDHLGPGDILVLNRTRVRHARTPGHRSTGGKVELLWLHRQGDAWRAMSRPAARLKPGEKITLEHGLDVKVVAKEPGGVIHLEVPASVNLEDWLDRHGHVPLPPYLEREDEPTDRERYQTVFARELGAVAAPTAGLHFTEGTFQALALRGVTVADLLLHVGPGTFRPIQSQWVHDHRLDPEWYCIPRETWTLVEPERGTPGRRVAVGTTVVRALESAARSDSVDPPSLEGWSDLFIAPPFEFKMVDALVTNFHLPRSSLLALVGAFAGTELIRAAYRAAVEARYRFYSYGDAMLIL